MVVGEANIHNIMGGMESTGGVPLHNHKRKLKQRFDIIKKLGQGTYGKVQLGINKETGQEVAIKTIKKCKIDTEADLIRIRREIQIMSSVQHPNIIHIYEVFENREKMVLVMEYAAGGELYDYLSKRKVLSEEEARRIFRQIATAVYYCHKHKICHRDLKLENILLDQVGNAKIADFGLSNVFDGRRLLSTFCGSPLYASPEIVKGTPYHGPEVDCWSLGVLLYTLVYGAMPFDGSNFKRLAKQISQSDYFEPKKPSPASPLIKEMLTVCPSKRADIERICTHWWVNKGYEQNCLDIAEDLAVQTPVRLDLLLSLVPQSASAEKLLVGDQPVDEDIANSRSSETLVPTRCHSIGSLMELDTNSSDRRISELFEEEPRTGDAKRKLETTPSMDETAAANVKRKERSRRKDKPDEREPRAYRSLSRHYSAPIPNSISEEVMDIEPTGSVTVPISKTVIDMDKIEATAACLELIKESKEKSPSYEKNETPVVSECEESHKPISADSIYQIDEYNQKLNKEEEKSKQKYIKSSNKSLNEDSSNILENVDKITNTAVSNKKANVFETKAPRDGAVKEQTEVTEKDLKKLKEKALSFDSETSNESTNALAKPVERRRSKIFETAEKFNQLASTTENEKPKKIFIPGVNVGGAKRAFERKASLSSVTTPPILKTTASKVIIDVPTDKKSEKNEKQLENSETITTENKLDKRDEAKKRAVDIITGAIGKPPMQRKLNGSPPQNTDSKVLDLKIQVGPDDVRSATVSVSTPIETKFAVDDIKSATAEATITSTSDTSGTENSQLEEPKMSSKMEITLKSATLPRRKTTKAEIILSGVKPVAFKSEVEAKIDAFQPQKLRTQRSEVAFPVEAAMPHTTRSASLEPEGGVKITPPRERIIPIQVESGVENFQHFSTPLSKPPMSQRSTSQRSGSLSRQSTGDSDTDSAVGSTVGPEPIRKSPREYIIPIAVEGGGYVTPRSSSLEPESQTGTPTSTNPSRSRFGMPRRMSSLLSDASEDESPFSPLHSEDILQRHMHRLRSSRPSRQPPEHADSLSSGEDDDDDGFELLTAENLFSTLLSRVRSLTQRLNVDDNRSTGFPRSRLFGRLGSNPPQSFWGINKPLSRRLSESQFKHSLSRDSDIFSRRDPISNPGTPNSPGSRSTPSRESVFEIGSNTLPRDKLEQEEVEAAQIRKEAQETLQQNLTPNLARRLSRQFIEQTRQPIPRSPSTSRDRYYLSPTKETLDLIDPREITKRYSTSDQIFDQTEYKGRSMERGIRRTNSLLEPPKIDRFERRSPRRSISLFDDDDDDKLLPPLPRHIMTLGRKYKESGKSNVNNARRENFYNYKTDKIQEESVDDPYLLSKENTDNVDNNNIENGSISEGTSISMCNSNNNFIDTISSVSVKSCETSPTESSSNLGDYSKSNCKSDISKNFETRLLAAENLIKESKLKNLMPQRFNPNLSCNYKDTDKCDKEALITISEPINSVTSKRRSYIPSLRLRSGSLTREPSVSGVDRRKSFADSQDNTLTGINQERSLLSKFFRGNSNNSKEVETKDNKTQKPKQHRISRFLRPDFFDTPREESQYVKEKEAQKAAENERRKSRFMKRKSESKECKSEDKEDKSCKDQKNEINILQKDKLDNSSDEKPKNEDKERTKIEKQGSKSSFLHSLEKKLEKFRSNDENSKPMMNGSISNDQRESQLRENSAPPNCFPTQSGLTKRALSVEDLALDNKNVKSVSKGKITSVLSLFKTADTKPNANGSRSQNMIMSKLKKSPPKCAKAESCLEEDTPSTSKLATKFGRIDNKSMKKIPENKKSPERIKSEHKRSPAKEKLKDKELISKEKKPLTEKQIKESKKVMQSESSTSSSTDPSKTKLDKMELKRKSSDESESLQRVVDNKLMESIANNEGKKLIKTKKNTNSLSKNEPITKIDKGEDVDKKMKKPIKSKENIDKEEVNGTKKKKIVRVVKKVIKKSSESSDSKSEEKSLKPTVTKKKIITTNKEKSPEDSNVAAQYLIKRNSPDNQIAVKSYCHSNVDSLPQRTSSTRLSHSMQNTNATFKTDITGIHTVPNQSNVKVPVTDLLENNEHIAYNSSNSTLQNTMPQNTLSIQAKSSNTHRPSRAGLKLDLSKIPQHTFRHTTPKKDSPKSGSPKGNSIESPKADVSINEDGSDKLIECLSKMTHHANITGNKIIIDKPLRAKDVAELKREVTECARIIENHVDLHNNRSTRRISDKTVNSGDQIENKKLQEIILDLPKKSNDIDSIKLTKESSEDCTNEFSPEEPESFDSWSICSADLNHNRGELHSPTSPSYSLFMRSDNSESVIDRIRRRSFYQRFNDRKRSLLTVPPPGVTSATLPRRFSFNSSRDRERNRLYNYSSSKISRGDKSYGLHGEEILCRKSPMDKERHSDNLSTSSYEHYSPEAKSTFDYYSRLPSSSHDSLRRYTKSPTLDLASARTKYHSTDIITENDLIGSYKSPLLRSSFNDGFIDSYYGRNISTTMLPRKYGSTVGSLEPKSVEYYEEILSPSNPDYLSSRETCRSPLLDGYLNRCENGYHHNSNLDLSQFGTDKQRSYTDKMSDVEFIEGNSRSFDQQTRNNVTP